MTVHLPHHRRQMIRVIVKGNPNAIPLKLRRRTSPAARQYSEYRDVALSAKARRSQRRQLGTPDHPSEYSTILQLNTVYLDEHTMSPTAYQAIWRLNNTWTPTVVRRNGPISSLPPRSGGHGRSVVADGGSKFQPMIRKKVPSEATAAPRGAGAGRWRAKFAITASQILKSSLKCRAIHVACIVRRERIINGAVDVAGSFH